jgi:hypothetical protein
MPRPDKRARIRAFDSSKLNTAAWSPRSAAAPAYCSAIVDLPLPGGPISSVDVPRSTPPPSSWSSNATPLATCSRLNSTPESALVMRGKDQQTAMPNHEVLQAGTERAAKLDDLSCAARP